MDTPNYALAAQSNLGAGRSIILWLLFFLFSLALGYPTLNRYDPRELYRDQNAYYRMVSGRITATPEDIPFCFRVLVPSIAKPFYWLARGRVGTWEPVWFGMLISNSLFCASFSFMLLLMGLRVLRDLPLTLLGCCLALLNYAVADLWLSGGYVDAAEGCLLLAAAWCMSSGKWWALPLIGVLGGLAKQSFLPFATIFAVTWWLSTERSKRTYGHLLSVLGMAATSFIAIVFAYRAVAGCFMMPWTMASQFWPHGDILSYLTQMLGDRRFWYPFVWLVPLGVWRLHRFPRPWVMATSATAVFALLLACYTRLANAGSSRPIFNIIAPLFSLSTAELIATGEPWNFRGFLSRQKA